MQITLSNVNTNCSFEDEELVSTPSQLIGWIAISCYQRSNLCIRLLRHLSFNAYSTQVASRHSGRSGFLHNWWGTNSYPSFSHVYNQVSPSSSHSYHPHLFSSEKHQPKSYGLHLPFLPSTSNKCLHQISIENHPKYCSLMRLEGSWHPNNGIIPEWIKVFNTS